MATEPAHPRRPALGWLCRPGADGASATVIRVRGDEEVVGAADELAFRADPRRRRQHVVQRHRLEPHVGVQLGPSASPRPRSPANTPAVLRGAPPARRLARTAAGSMTRPSPPYLADSTTRGEPRQAASDGGGRGLLPGPPRPRAEPGRGTHRPGPRRRPRPRQSRAFGAADLAAVLATCHRPPAVASRPRRRVQPARPRARPPRRRDRGAPLSWPGCAGGERPPLSRRGRRRTARLERGGSRLQRRRPFPKPPRSTSWVGTRSCATRTKFPETAPAMYTTTS